MRELSGPDPAQSPLADRPYDFELPVERIAQRPVRPYHAAKLMVHTNGAVVERSFWDIVEFLDPRDLFVFNDSRVIPARLFGNLQTGGAAELLLLEHRGENEWVCLGKPLKKMRAGGRLTFPEGLTATVIERPAEHRVVVRFGAEDPCLSLKEVGELIRRVGVMPVPPYIRGGRGDDEDRRDYQTSFAKVEGSVAAPTASLHFTPDLLARIQGVGCGFQYVTLHVGAPSFTAVWNDEVGTPEIIPPGGELYRFSRKALENIVACRRRGGRVIAVGTTVVRALESMVRNNDGGDGEWYSTNLFIRPGFEFRTIDRMVTNFHQPRSTHLLLVEAFIGATTLDQLYQLALKSDYRFFSYGDGMLVGG